LSAKFFVGANREIVRALVIDQRFYQHSLLFFAIRKMKSQASRLFDGDGVPQFGSSQGPIFGLFRGSRFGEEGTSENDFGRNRIGEQRRCSKKQRHHARQRPFLHRAIELDETARTCQRQFDDWLERPLGYRKSPPQSFSRTIAAD
jgi:hypothetical protein